ncbi:MAG: M20/M25/M40 family metallo-hydrolase [Chitinophagales bacterium]|nr:M20/M25/M40 family metallo-hydrolase [Chitinophagales bacterium]
MDEIIIDLLQKIIGTPSHSKEETEVATLIRNFLQERGIPYEMRLNNTWCYNKYFQPELPTILLNSHIDTVRPNANWKTNPYEARIEEGKLFGLGSNDAGGALVCLLGAFLHFYEDDGLPFNLLFAATAEEEISGRNGIESMQDITQKCSFALVGEPTELHMAIAEKGLMVVDGVVTGKSGHAAREEGDNAIYLALKDVAFFKDYQFPKQSATLGKLKMSLTIIQAGTQHNVVPGSCQYTVDIRMIPEYGFQEVLDIIQPQINGILTPRSMRLKPSFLPPQHILHTVAQELNIPTFGSSTLSDQALLNIPSVKIGPGKSERSHTAEEFIYLSELHDGLETYIQIISTLKRHIIKQNN